MILDNLKTTEEVAALLELAPETLVIWRCHGKGPPYLKVGRKVWYPLDRLDAWLESQVRVPYEPEKTRGKPFSGQAPSPQWKHGPTGHKTREERRAASENETRLEQKQNQMRDRMLQEEAKERR